MERWTPPDGLATWPAPDPASAPGPDAPGRLRVVVVEQQQSGWAYVRFDNGWECWLDGRQLLDVAPPDPRRGQLIAGAAVIAVVAVIAGWLILRSDDGDDDALDGNPASGAQQTSSTAGTSSPAAVDSGSAGAAGNTVDPFDPTLPTQDLIAAIDTAAQNPADSGRDDLMTTIALRDELTTAGVDVTGLDATVYFGDGAEAFLVLETSDDSGLLNGGDDGAGDRLLQVLLDSPVLDFAGVSWLAVEHSGSDEDGPFLITFIVTMADLEEAAASGTDITDRVAVGVERP